LIVLWSHRSETDNSSEIQYSIAQLDGQGHATWSNPLALTNNQYADLEPAFLVNDDGSVLAVDERTDETIQDDSNLYFKQFGVQLSGLTFPTQDLAASGLSD